jgi:trk system potassium uptake protein TrkA
MNVVIVGGGEIGSQIAAALHNSHDVTVVDIDKNRADTFDQLDVRFVVGSGSDPKDLHEAGVPRASAFIACTTNDDVNVLACLAAKGLGAKDTMAFVTRQRYLDAFADHGPMESVGLVINRVLWPQRTLAHQIVDIVRVPRALDSAFFAGGRIKMLEYRLEPGDPFMGQTLLELSLPDNVLVVGVIQREKFTIPDGQTVLHPGDKVIFMGSAQSMRLLEARFSPSRKQLQNVVIVGGGNVGFMVAEELQHERMHVTIVEENEARCEKLATYLPRVMVLKGDGTDLELLESERVEDAHVLIAVTDDDSKNLLISLLAKQLGIPKVITRVGRARNQRLFERVGIDISLTPRTAAVQEVLNWLKVDQVDHLASIEGRAEVIEVTYPYSKTVGMVKNLGAPPNSLIGAVFRKDKVIVPSGDTTVQHGDHLFMVTLPEGVDKVHRWLER